eukprot:COSAG06_NODE_21398_length_758_cov_1.166920_1_plen_109_part_10
MSFFRGSLPAASAIAPAPAGYGMCSERKPPGSALARAVPPANMPALAQLRRCCVCRAPLPVAAAPVARVPPAAEWAVDGGGAWPRPTPWAPQLVACCLVCLLLAPDHSQ